MDKLGQIIIIEDSKGDQELFREALENLEFSNEVLFFEDGNSVLEYLNATPNLNPFLIISDINLPRLSGIELRDKIYNNKELAVRCIPYLFFTTSAAQADVINAYSKSVQGFFVKPDSISELEEMLALIINYWKYCKAPNEL